ncbi:Manganese transport system membrane protein MntB [Planctomycetes bacterium CA13]|uniref:Manganese transport system membrane protein MntB n=1 Tax=Novipirellula herctigrandis TaxID=2527986 RepID=A0A5C5YNH2_9BACT|nr:Manganese transport system membrane protein MntB [Planctomycetes bacterium CA13]
MWVALRWDWNLDGWIITVGVLSAVAAALLGNFLVLRRMSLLGDAISHAVLPGLAAAFMITSSRNSLPMFLGAVIVGVLTAFFTEWIRSVGDVDEGASMGVVFTSLFALGLVMIVQAADHVDLDPSCVLYGAIEMTPLDKISVAGFAVPRAALSLGIVALANLAFVTLFMKELKLSSFDPALATTTGFNATLMHYLLMILVAVTAVASFESVGNILVVAMFVVPPAAAYMLTDRLTTMILISVIIAASSAVLGHIAALTVPGWFGYRSTTTAGMMAVVAGLILLFAVAFAPRHGIVVKRVRHHLLGLSILADDVVALLYRMDERGESLRLNANQLATVFLVDRFSIRAVLRWLRLRDQIERSSDGYNLTNEGRTRAQGLIRSHRLWEQYLVTLAGIDADRIHDKAESLEHFTDAELRSRLDQETNAPTVDPHGRPIPNEERS